MVLAPFVQSRLLAKVRTLAAEMSLADAIPSRAKDAICASLAEGARILRTYRASPGFAQRMSVILAQHGIQFPVAAAEAARHQPIVIDVGFLVRSVQDGVSGGVDARQLDDAISACWGFPLAVDVANTLSRLVALQALNGRGADYEHTSSGPFAVIDSDGALSFATPAGPIDTGLLGVQAPLVVVALQPNVQLGAAVPAGSQPGPYFTVSDPKGGASVQVAQLNMGGRTM